MSIFQPTSFAGESGEFKGDSIITMPMTNIKLGDQIEWLDNDRIAFTGYSREHHEGTSVFRWNIASRVEYLLGGIRRICFDGKNLYALARADTNLLKRFMITPPDYSSVNLLEESIVPVKPAFFDDQLCIERSVPAKLLGRTWKSLSKAHGYLDFGPLQPTGEPIRITIVSEDGITRHDTGLILENPIMPQVVYVPHKEAYFVYNLNLIPKERQQWSDSGFLDAWFIAPDGAVETVKIPSGSWVSNQGTIHILPLLEGYIIVAQGFERNGEPGTAGAYYISSEATSKQLVSGFVANPRVSPDGCRLVFAFQQRFDLKVKEERMVSSSRKLIINNICNKREK